MGHNLSLNTILHLKALLTVARQVLNLSHMAKNISCSDWLLSMWAGHCSDFMTFWTKHRGRIAELCRITSFSSSGKWDVMELFTVICIKPVPKHCWLIALNFVFDLSICHKSVFWWKFTAMFLLTFRIWLRVTWCTLYGKKWRFWKSRLKNW